MLGLLWSTAVPIALVGGLTVVRAVARPDDRWTAIPAAHDADGDAPGWASVQGWRPHGRAARAWFLGGLFYGVVALLPVGLVLAASADVHALDRAAVWALLCGPFVTAMGLAAFHFAVARTVREAELWISPRAPALPCVLQVVVRQRFRRAVMVRTLEVSARCLRRTRDRRGREQIETLWNGSTFPVTNRTVRAGEQFEARTELELPYTGTPSTAVGGSTQVAWAVVVRLDLPRRPDYTGEYPIHVGRDDAAKAAMLERMAERLDRVGD